MTYSAAKSLIYKRKYLVNLVDQIYHFLYNSVIVNN